MAACRTRQPELIATAFEVLASKEGDGADAAARRKLSVLLGSYCVERGVSPSAAIATRAASRLRERVSP